MAREDGEMNLLNSCHSCKPAFGKLFFMKVNILALTGHFVSVADIYLCHCSINVAINTMQTKWHDCFNKTLSQKQAVGQPTHSRPGKTLVPKQNAEWNILSYLQRIGKKYVCFLRVLEIPKENGLRR